MNRPPSTEKEPGPNDPPGLAAGEPIAKLDPEDPATTRQKRTLIAIFRAVGLSLFLAGIIVSALWYNRVTVANALIPALLRGVTGIEATMQITQVEFDHMTVRQIVVLNGPTLERLSLSFSDDLFAPPLLDTIDAEGLTGAIEVAENGGIMVTGLPFRSLQDTQSDNDTSPAALPFRSLTIRDIDIGAQTPVGRQLISGSIILELPAAPALFPIIVNASLEDTASQSAVLTDIVLNQTDIAGSGTIDLSLEHWLPYLVPGVTAAQGRTTLSFDLIGGGMAGTSVPVIDPATWLAAISVNAEAGWAGVAVEGREFDRIALSDAQLTLSSEGGIIELNLPNGLEAELSGPPPSIIDGLPMALAAYFNGPIQLAVDTFPESASLRIVPDHSGGWRGSFNLSLDAVAGPLSLRVLPESISVDQNLKPTNAVIQVVNGTVVRGLDLPRDISAEVTINGLMLPLTQILDDGTIPAITLPISLNATIFGNIADPLWAERTELELSGRLNLDPDLSGIRIDIGAGSRITTKGLTGTGDLRLSPNLGAAVPSGAVATIEFAPSDPAGSLLVSGALHLDPLEVAFVHVEEDAAAVNLRFSRQDVSFRFSDTGVTLALGPFGLEETGTGLSINFANLHLQTTQQTGNATLTAERMALAGDTILPGALSLQLNGRHATDGTIYLDGPISFADGQLSASITASVNPRAGALGRFSVNTAPVEFGNTELSFRDVVPAAFFADPSPDVAGTLRLSVNGVLGDTLSGAALLYFEALSVQTRDGSINNLQGHLVFDIANFPATGENQILTAVLSVPGMGRIPVHADFKLNADASVELNELRLEALGGTISLIDTELDPGNLNGTGAIQIRRINIERLTRLAGIEGISATGRLSGILPIRYVEGEVIVENGTVTSDGGGRLRIDNPGLSQALQGQGETVEFVAEILRDFHFDALSAEVTLPDAANGRAAIGISGRNPNVLDGHPVDLNVSLSTDHRALYDLISLVAALPTRLLRGLPVQDVMGHSDE